MLLVNGSVFLFFYVKKKENTTYHGTLSFYLFYLLILNVITGFMSRYGVNNLYLSHAYFIPQALILGKLFIDHFLTKLQVRFAKIYLISSLSFLVIQNILMPEMILSLNIVEIFLMNYFLLICSLFYFYNTLRTQRPHKFLIFGILFYSILSTSTFLLTYLANELNSDFSRVITKLHIFLLFFYQLMIGIQWFTFISTKNKWTVKTST